MQQTQAATIALLAYVWISGCYDSSTGALTTVQLDPAPAPARKNSCRSFDVRRNVYFGDLHVHTSYSFDAFAWGTRTDPAGSYAFARGESATLGVESGQPPRFARLERSLDFAAVTDHAEHFGEYPPGMFSGYESAADAWMHEQMAAEAANDNSSECTFTAFIAYEWTGATGSSWWHRNIIFRNSHVPRQAISSRDERTPEGLWSALRALCLEAGNGCDVLAIPHNPNYSNGSMFSIPDTISLSEATLRASMEPVAEIYQAKGNSECKLGVETEDPLCEMYQKFQVNCRFDSLNPLCSSGNFVRNAFKRGLQVEERIGVNPLKLGVIASTDTHNGTPGATDEFAYQGQHGWLDASPRTRVSTSDSTSYNASGGLVAIWSEENSRDSLFDGLQRRETYATSGTRPKLRFFGGWDFPSDLCGRVDLVTVGYTLGTPMGGDLPPKPNNTHAPSFVVAALKDPGTVRHPGTPLQQIQIIKGWLDPDSGATFEKIYQVAGNPRNDASVDPESCEIHGQGSDSLCAVWRDPDFHPRQRAFYYARLLENPTCSVYQRDCNQIIEDEKPKSCTDGSFPMTVQQRAWSSPIWYQPSLGRLPASIVRPLGPFPEPYPAH